LKHVKVGQLVVVGVVFRRDERRRRITYNSDVLPPSMPRPRHGGSARLRHPPSQRFAAMLVAVMLVAAIEGHHGSADYDVSREVAVRGTVKEWRWSNPHTWFFVTVDAAGGRQEWSGEGPPLNWAEARGWSKAMFAAGETVTLFMYPSRRDPHSGLVKRIQRRNGDVVPVSRPWLDRE
jgi:hypothetical protein